jgi:tryptophan synthase beta chain
MMNTWGATCVPSPSKDTNAGRKLLEENPDSPGSLGIAISEAVEDAVTSKNTRYSLGSVLNHVLMHQTVIGLETKKQLERFGEKKVDVVTGCAGGGSNFSGLAFPFVLDKINGADIAIIPAEPTSCPTMTRAPFVYDHGDSRHYPLLMHSLGHNFIPHSCRRLRTWKLTCESINHRRPH